MDALLAGLRAAGEETRLRLLHLLSLNEFNVSELTQILNQSQPRVSRHLKLMQEAGLLERFKEGSWVMFRVREDGMGGDIARKIVSLIPHDDPVARRDLKRVEAIVAERRERAARYFAANAGNWDELRSLHVSEQQVEETLTQMAAGEPVDTLIDIGTGTGQILALLAPLARQAIGIDSSRQMLAIARSRLDEEGLRHARVRLCDLFELPFADQTAGLAVFHQVLHYLDRPDRALAEAARVLKPGGRLLVADFAPHELEFLRETQAHHRLGIGDSDMRRWMARAGLEVEQFVSLAPPENLREKGLTVLVWMAKKVKQPGPHAG